MTVEPENPEAVADQVGATYGSYRAVSELGRGGMGVVYLAEHHIMGKLAAVKVLLPEYSGREDLVSRFFNEARAAARLDYPAFVEVFDCGMARGKAFMVMEYVAGENLGAVLRRDGRLPPSRAVALTRAIAEAMAVAHENGIVHRDLKPDNIILTSSKSTRPGSSPIKILDFGIAKLSAGGEGPTTRTGMLMGTPLYMSPEQCRGSGTVDGRTDIYSLGCILHALLTGTPPFPRAGDGEIIFAHLSEPVPPLERHALAVPPSLEALLMRLLAKDPAHRPQTMAEVASALAAIEPALAPGPAAGTVPSLSTSRKVVLPDSAPVSWVPPPRRATPEPPATQGSTTFSRASGEVVQAAPRVPAGPRRRTALWAGAAAAVLVASSVAVLVLRAPPESPRPTAGQPPPLPLSPPGPPEHRPPPAPPRPIPADLKTVVRLTSDPPGARVLNASDRTVLGTTPFEQRVDRSDRPLDLLIEKRGFRPESVRVTLDGDFEKSITLQKRARAADPDENRKL